MKLLHILLSLLGLGMLVACKKSGYQIKNGSVYYKDNLMGIADYESFEALNSLFAHDKDRGYYRGVALEHTTGASFIALDDYYAKDKSVVYFCDNYIDFKLFETTRRNKIIELMQADPATFEAIADGYTYAKDKSRAYYQGVGFTVADVASFVPLDPQFGRDRQVGYFQQAPIQGSDGTSFAVLSRNFAKDKRKVYFFWTILDTPIDGAKSGIRIIPNALPDSFTPVGAYFGTDKNHAFYKDILISEADPSSFTSLDEINMNYARDNTKIFFQNHRIETADRQSFALLTDEYAQDTRTIFYQDRPLPYADRATFTMLEHGYAKDALHVYYEGEILARADPASFAMVTNDADRDATDKSHSYASGHPLKPTR